MLYVNTFVWVWICLKTSFYFFYFLLFIFNFKTFDIFIWSFKAKQQNSHAKVTTAAMANIYSLNVCMSWLECKKNPLVKKKIWKAAAPETMIMMMTMKPPSSKQIWYVFAGFFFFFLFFLALWLHDICYHIRICLFWQVWWLGCLFWSGVECEFSVNW